jgi:16S rRNA (adenine(1408)-N(1))-methyltransferase
VVDLGTGDGRFVLHRAKADPRALVIGIDADAASMRAAARKAGANKTALPNALFVVASAEQLPRELDGFAHEVRIHFPWGSLLRGLLQGEPWLLAGLARLSAPGAAITALVSVTEHDAGAAARMPVDPWSLAPAYEGAGIPLREIRSATLDELAAGHSSWARRLGASSSRPVTLLRAERT